MIFGSSIARRLDDHIRDDDRRFTDLQTDIHDLSKNLDQKHEENRKANARLLYGIIMVLLSILGWIAATTLGEHFHFK